MKKTQMLLIALLIGAMNFNSMAIAAAPAKPATPHEVTRERAGKVMENKNSKESLQIFTDVAKIITKAAKAEAKTIHLENALKQGSADLLLAMYKINEENNLEAAKLVSELASGVKSQTEADHLAAIASKKLSDIPGASEFIANVKSDIRNGDTLTGALKKQAGIQAGKLKEKMSAEDWLKKFMECV